MRVLAFADDLTGALEAGAKFAAVGLLAVVATSIPDDPLDDVLVFDTETRHLSAAEAGRVVAAFARAGAPLIYKKTDSTLRGNIGAELRALRRAYGGPIAYVPAYPAMGRTVCGGCLFVHGVPLAETEFARDPLNPAPDGCVRSLLDPDCECTVFDGKTDADVGAAADRILEAGCFRIVAGPAAIAEALAARLGELREIQWPRIPRCLVINGSLSEVSRRQIQTALAGGAISTAPEAPWRLLALPVSQADDPLRLARATGECVRSVLGRESLDGIAVFGGDTAFGVLAGLGLPLLRPLGEVVPGVPVSAIEGRREFLITKAGGFGEPALLSRLRLLLSGEGA